MMQFCNTTLVDDWDILPLNTIVRGKVPDAYSGRQYRLFLPPADACKALHIRLSQNSGTRSRCGPQRVTVSGDTDLYITNDLTGPPGGGPYRVADVIAFLGYSPVETADQGYPGGFPWFSYRTKGTCYPLCAH